MKVYLRGVFTPQGNAEIDIYKNNPHTEFTRDEITLKLTAGNKNFEVLSQKEIDHDGIIYMRDTDKHLPKNEIIECYFQELHDTVLPVISSLKFFYGIYETDIHLPLKRKYTWSLDNIAWHDLPDRNEYSWRGINPIYTIPDNLMPGILRLESEEIKPFYAFEHLHKAFNDRYNTRYQWINATIAAELAFKEFLIQHDQRTATLMESMPSPPIDKLYKSVLTDFTGAPSPYYKQLKAGAEMRNKLIHQPGTPAPDYNRTQTYLHQVENALYHLLTLLHPGDKLIHYFYNLSMERFERFQKTGN